MSPEDLAAAMLAFESNGGKVEQIETNQRTLDPGLVFCTCGCRGNYTDHSMRKGESGRVGGRRW